jgi:tetratricopeptide (TPR) repeat protein
MGMATREKSGHFIGRREEIQLFQGWLRDLSAPWIPYFYGSTEELEKKGGIGKTWLLRECARVAEQEHSNIGVLIIDFFTVEDRDRLFLAEKVAQAFHQLCPEWNYTAFAAILDQYRTRQLEDTLSKPTADVAEDETTFTAIAAALVEDIQRLEPLPEQQQKTLLLCFDTFELIAENPIIAVLRRSQKFPDSYGSTHIKVLMAGRNRLNWQQLCSLVILHPSLFIDLDKGLQYFKRHFQTARRLRKRVFVRLLFQERQNMLSAMSLAQRNDMQLREMQLLRLADATDEALAVLQQIKKQHDVQWYEANYYDVLIEQGQCYQKQTLWDDAEHCFNECLRVETVRNNQGRRAFLLNQLGLIARHRGQFAIALTRYQQSAEIYKRLGNMSNYALVLNNMSFVYRYQGKIDEASLRCKLGWRIRRNLFQEGKIDEVPLGWSLSTLGVIYLSTGNIAEAESRFQEAFELYSQANSKANIAATYYRFGQVQFERRNLEAALAWFEQAQQAAIEASVEHYIMSLSWQGRIYILQKRWPEAQELFEQAIQRAQQVADDYQIVEGLIYLTDCLAAQGQQERSEQFLLEAEQRASQRNYYELCGRAELRRGEIACHHAGFQQAFHHFVAYCHYMALYNYAEYSAAVQHLIDALIGVPNEFTSSIVDNITIYWQTHHLDERYPELIRECEEFKALL